MTLNGHIKKITIEMEGNKQMEASDTSPAASVEPTTEELEAKLAARREAEQEQKTALATEPVLDQIAASDKASFIDKLREVASNLKEAGQIGEEQLLSSGEQGTVTATLIKLLGEIVDKIK
jgi:hypothetical protein